MATVRELVVKFSLEADTKAIKKFDAALTDATKAAKGLVSFGAKLTAAYAGFMGVAAKAAVGAGDFAEEILRTSSAFGVATHRIQEISFAFGALGASQDDMADALSTVAQRSIRAQRGAKRYQEAFGDLGITMERVASMDISSLFDEIIRGASRTTDTVQATSAMVTLFGDDLGRRVARGLRTSGSSFQDYIQIIREVGGVFDEQMLDQARDAQIQFRMLGAVFQMLRRRIGLELAPVFADFVNKIMNGFRRNQDAINAFIVRLRDGLARELGRIETIAVRVNNTVQESFGGWANLADKVAIAMAGIVSAMAGAKVAAFVAALVPLFKALTIPVIILGAKIALISLLVAGWVLIFEDLWHAIQGNDSLIGNIIEKLEDMGGIASLLAIPLRLTIEHFRILASQVIGLWREVQNLAPLFKFVFSALLIPLMAGVVWAVNGVILALNVIVFVLRVIVAAVTEVVEIFQAWANRAVDATNSVRRAFSRLWEGLKTGANDAFDWIIGQFLGMIGKLADHLDRSPVGRLLKRGLSATAELATPAMQAITGISDTQLAAAGASANAVVDRHRPSMKQQNVDLDFAVTINATGEEGGRAAARAFEEEMRKRDPMQATISYWLTGDV